jgi:hypothetical protein
VDDVIETRVLVRIGVPESTVYRRCRANGPWQLLAPATVLLDNGVPPDANSSGRPSSTPAPAR